MPKFEVIQSVSFTSSFYVEAETEGDAVVKAKEMDKECPALSNCIADNYDEDWQAFIVEEDNAKINP